MATIRQSLATALTLAAAMVLCGTVSAAGTSQQVEMVDAQGFGQPMTAATLQVPRGWRTQGGVNWQRGDACVSNQMRIAWVATSPRDDEAFEVMHPYAWQVQGRSIQMNPCPVMAVASARAFLMAVVQQRRPGARVLNYSDRADIVASATSQAPPPQNGMQRRIEAGEVVIAYAGSGGSEIQERLWTSVTFTAMQNSLMGNAGTVYAHRRLGGAPDRAVSDRIVASMKTNPAWMAKVSEASQRFVQTHSANQSRQIQQWHAGEMARINAKGAADRAAIRSQTQRDIANIHNQTQANTQATNDRIQRRTLEGVGEYNTYSNTAGEPVRSSIHGGDRVLQHPDGTYSSTSDPYYQPPGSVELQRVR
ncbi:hypothetical protein [Comamonas badia]|uniref:hypothetical protein n=1 Tax=Comamonas badia TaxID=265291 RepID=UPI0003FB0404|nr:hypothetical protein [Comamonas badia]